MHALGLDPQDPQHEQYYRAMRVSKLLGPCLLYQHVLFLHQKITIPCPYKT